MAGTKQPAAKPRSKAEIARENGRKGGRPRKEALLEDFAHIEAPPTDSPLKLVRWTQDVLAIDMFRMIRGRANAALSSDLRNTARAIAAGIPPDIIAEAKRLMDEDAGHISSDGGGPDTVDADDLEDDGEDKPTRSISG